MIDDNTRRIYNDRKKIDANTATNETQDQLIDDNTRRIYNDRKYINANTETNENQDQLIDDNTRRIYNDRNYINKNTDDIAQAQKDIEQNEQDIATNKGDIAQNKSDIAENRSDIDHNTAKLDSTTKVAEQNVVDIANANLAIEQNAKGVAHNSELINSLKSDVAKLQDRDEELAAGIAAAVALDTPLFQPGQEFAVRFGWGAFDGKGALGVTAAGILDRGFMGERSTATLDLGVASGFEDNSVALRGGLTIGW